MGMNCKVMHKETKEYYRLYSYGLYTTDGSTYDAMVCLLFHEKRIGDHLVVPKDKFNDIFEPVSDMKEASDG